MRSLLVSCRYVKHIPEDTHSVRTFLTTGEKFLLQPQQLASGGATADRIAGARKGRVWLFLFGERRATEVCSR